MAYCTQQTSTKTSQYRPELDVDWIHPWIGLGWIGLCRNFTEKCWIGLGQRSYISKFLYSVFRK